MPHIQDDSTLDSNLTRELLADRFGISIPFFGGVTSIRIKGFCAPNGLVA
jgi:hypothetical protein